MFSRWSLSLVVLGSLILMASATTPPSVSPAEPVATDFVSCEVRGRLEWVADPYTHCYLDPRIAERTHPHHYEIVADGQRLVLDLGEHGAHAQRLVDQQVIVSGSLAGNRVTVSDLRQPLDESLIQYVNVTVRGRLECVPISIPRIGNLIVVWNIRSGTDTYALSFSNAQDELAATKRGGPVVLWGKLKGGQIEVTSVVSQFEYDTTVPLKTRS
jgi:hypothetical protein